MSKVRMYSTVVCPYCVMAERLLRAKGVRHIEKLHVDADPALREEMTHLTRRRTVPQFFWRTTCGRLHRLGCPGSGRPFAGVAGGQSRLKFFGHIWTAKSINAYSTSTTGANHAMSANQRYRRLSQPGAKTGTDKARHRSGGRGGGRGCSSRHLGGHRGCRLGRLGCRRSTRHNGGVPSYGGPGKVKSIFLPIYGPKGP